MEEISKLPKCCGLKILFLTCILFLNSTAKSEVYTVGDADQWSTGISYLSWSQKYNFTVGDVLVFKYVKGQHNVFQVREPTYQSCNTSTGVWARYEGGNDQVNLTKAKKYWFICNVDEHCLGGMRFVIHVRKNTTSTTNGTSTIPQTEPSTPYSNGGYAYPSKGMGTVIYLLVYGTMPTLFLLACGVG
ncbi:hypothetical protein ACSBR2_019633 [Camellia fascicularis]